jgi:hypothetical protein
MMRMGLTGSMFVAGMLAWSASVMADDAAQHTELESFLQSTCRSCHSGHNAPSQFVIPAVGLNRLSEQLEDWEKIVRRLQNGDMPPLSESRPDPDASRNAVNVLTELLDDLAQREPRPGRTDSLRRLNRTEYHNAIRDLLDLNIDVTAWLPADESSHGFDHITVTGLSPTLLNRYVSAAERISRLAMSREERSPGGETFRVRGDVTQDGHRVEGLPPGTRGGLKVDWNFPRTGTYQVQIRLMRDRNDNIEGLRGTHQLDILLDRQRVHRFTLEPPPRGHDDREVDASLIAEISVNAGRHQVGVTFADSGRSLLETDRQPLNVHFNFYRHPRLGPAIHEVTIAGPMGESTTGQSQSRQRIMIRQPGSDDDVEICAREILSPLMRRAYRRPVTDDDFVSPMNFFRDAYAAEKNFDAGIERALASILVNPQFLFRIERNQVTGDSDLPHATSVSDIELASQLAFFLWSSLPDEELLTEAEKGKLSQPDALKQQTTRMLADRRAESLVTNFADQWLYLRNLDAVTPDARLFPDFDQNLRDAFRRETELLFADVLHDDGSVLLLLDARYTWLNERLARHYGIPHVRGDHFRRVALEPDQHRGGILRHGSVLSVTSYATRTSPVLRGKWVLENLLGSPPPPPPPDVPTLQDNTIAATLPLRERLSAHRENQACAVCHDRIDPVGFALENYDAVGRWRESEFEHPVNAAGGTPDGRQFTGVSGLEEALLQRPEVFVRTVSEKLLIYAIGRGLNPGDGAAVRRIVSGAAAEEFRFSSIVHGIVQSVPFRMRERQRR